MHTYIKINQMHFLVHGFDPEQDVMRAQCNVQPTPSRTRRRHGTSTPTAIASVKKRSSIGMPNPPPHYPLYARRGLSTRTLAALQPRHCAREARSDVRGCRVAALDRALEVPTPRPHPRHQDPICCTGSAPEASTLRVKFSRDDNTPSGTVQWSKPPAFNATWDTSPHSGTHRRAQIKSSQSVSHAGALGAEHAPRERARDLRRGPVQRPTRRPPRAADAAEQSRRRRADVGAAGVGLEPRPRDPREGPRRRRGAAVPGEHGTYI
jgi:hypothetical protein